MEAKGLQENSQETDDEAVSNTARHETYEMLSCVTLEPKIVVE